ncbi:MAG: alpha/beta fold hydrolase [Candidatus Rokubacteria bacterium]|nr:alpha/beta fold hydrolase [Candidatus Rokubacteria bacterium]
MQCLRCRHENPWQAKFCLECGARIALACPKCGAELPGGAKFCLECGQPVGGTSSDHARFASPEAYTPKYLAEKILTSRNALEGERKQVTVLFADLKGSMELLADRDPEEARRLLDPVLERMMEAVHRYEGTVNQVMGDGIMALFGAPLAHEDHAVRASYAAHRMQESVGRYSEEIQRAHGVPVQIRVGLNSGEVVVRSIGSDLHMDYTAVGQTTHLAARMEQMARPGSILLTAGTLRLAENYVRVKPLGPIAVKGLPAPTEVYELTGAGPVRARFQAAAARGLSRFVGRDAELEQLRRALEQAREGHGQVVAVVGEAGVGKSRLFFEFTRSHRTQGWLLLESSSVSYGRATSYLPVVDLLKGYFQIEDRDAAQRAREKVTGKVLTLDERLKEVIPPVLSLLEALPEDDPFRSLDPPQRRGRTLDALKRLLFRESQRQPLLLVFEDLHWVDSESQALLDALVESLPSGRILLLTNYRPEYEDRWMSKTYYTRLRVDPLPPESADELLDALVGEAPSLGPLKTLLKERTGGNPFFLEESVRTLLETGALAGQRGAYRLERDLDALEVPATVQALLAARIDRLPAEEKRLLQSAAAIGMDIPLALLQEIAELPQDDLRRTLAHLQGAEFLYETRLFPDPEYTFKHALTHDVAYGSLLQDRRRMLHRRVGEVIEERYVDRLPEFFEALALHFYRGEVWDRAARYDLEVAGKAKATYAYSSAARFCRRALELAEKHAGLDEERVRGLVLLGDLSSLMDDLAEANKNYEGALAVAADEAVRGAIAGKLHRPRSVVRDGARIVFYEHGSGDETLLLMNPIAYGLSIFQPMLENLCQEFRIVTMDPRGTGASDRLPARYTHDDHAADVGAVIEAAGGGSVVGIGISRGGNILVKLAAARPLLVKKLVLVGTPLDDMGPASVSRLSNEFDVKFRASMKEGNLEGAIPSFVATIITEPGTGDVAEQFVQNVLRLPRETIVSFFSLDPAANIVPLLEGLTVPTLVTQGTHDRRVSFDAARYLVEHIPGAQLYLFEGRGHLPIFTATGEFCEVLRHFVRTGAVPERAGGARAEAVDGPLTP